MNKTWISADWHIGDDRFKILGRPFKTLEEYHALLIKNHNALVGKDDTFILNGDAVYQKADPKYLELISQFNGKKILVRGNHDGAFTNEQFAPYFDKIIDDGQGMFIEGMTGYVTHYPSTGKPDTFNLVGHIHAAWKYQLNMFNIGVDANHFTPIDIDSINDHLTAIEKFYDEDVWIAYNRINSEYVGVRGKPGSYFRK